MLFSENSSYKSLREERESRFLQETEILRVLCFGVLGVRTMRDRHCGRIRLSCGCV